MIITRPCSRLTWWLFIKTKLRGCLYYACNYQCPLLCLLLKITFNWRPKLEGTWFISQRTSLLCVERKTTLLAMCLFGISTFQKPVLGHVNIMTTLLQKTLFSKPNLLAKAKQDKPGFETISSLQSGLYFTTLGMMNLKIFTLRCTKLRRLSPSCWRAPAVTMTSLECAVTL